MIRYKVTDRATDDLLRLTEVRDDATRRAMQTHKRYGHLCRWREVQS